MTLDDIIMECQQEGVFKTYILPQKKIPLYENQTCIGFYAPKRRYGRYCMGFVYIASQHRRKGYMTKHALVFKKTYPGMLWYCEVDHTICYIIAKKIGLTLIGRERKEGKEWDVYEDIQPGRTHITLQQ